MTTTHHKNITASDVERFKEQSHAFMQKLSDDVLKLSAIAIVRARDHENVEQLKEECNKLKTENARLLQQLQGSQNISPVQQQQTYSNYDIHQLSNIPIIKTNTSPPKLSSQQQNSAFSNRIQEIEEENKNIQNYNNNNYQNLSEQSPHKQQVVIQSEDDSSCEEESLQLEPSQTQFGDMLLNQQDMNDILISRTKEVPLSSNIPTFFTKPTLSSNSLSETNPHTIKTSEEGQTAGRSATRLDSFTSDSTRNNS
eukprot:c21290_g1_i1.p1 GENE.c21290_g1_i1~~c21290_g1_i1.p1  ORF type:complete len:254 (+),score=106.92 c21290_g1_i1:34-795(+)